MISDTFSHYKIITRLGAGGMGEVYKAQDTVLDRPVALKILPGQLVEDADRLRRFVQEARSASALNHPNIVTIYEIGQLEDTDGTVHYIAMEFVDGETLHEKIHRDRTDLKKLVEILVQVAEGLAKAHSAGIVHRDLKPENIMITEDGFAKILDFGLAKLIEAPETSPQDLEEAATAIMDKTRPGMVMGTLGYMSPEQVQGRPIDQRSDIFSFGCILYEAAARKKPFAGDSVIDSLHKIVYGAAPSIREDNPNAPAELQRMIRKCLAKDPAERYQSIKDVALDLRDLIREYDTQPIVSGAHSQPATLSPTLDTQARTAVTGAHPHMSYTTGEHVGSPTGAAVILPPPRSRVRWSWIAGAVALLLALAGITILYTIPRSPERRVPTFQNVSVTKLTNTGTSLGAVISPDGKYVVHVLTEAGKQSVWVRQTATSSNVQIVEPAEAVYSGLRFAPDGDFVYYLKLETDKTIRTLYRVPVLGGTPKRVLDDVDSAITFSPDRQRICFIRHSADPPESALIIANADGGQEQKLTVRKQPNVFLRAVWSPDGGVIACSAQNLTGGFHVEVLGVGVADGASKSIGEHKWRVVSGLDWLSDGSALILSGFEPGSAADQMQIWHLGYPSGKARRITNDLNSYAGVSLSADSSSLVTLQAHSVSNIWVAPDGDAGQATRLTSGSASYNQVSWTPDGRIVYVSDASGAADIWIADGDGKNARQLTSGPGVNVFPTVAPDGRFVIFCSNGGKDVPLNLWRIDLDGNNLRQLTSGEGEYWPACSSDGKWVFFTPLVSATLPAIWKVPSEGGEPVRVTDDGTALVPEVSPDGRFILAVHHDSPASLPKLAVFPVEGGKPVHRFDVRITRFQGRQYCWRPDGKAVLYLQEQGGVSNIWSQPLAGGPPIQVTEFKTDQIFSFDWARDGKRLLCARGVTTTDVILIKDQPE